MVATICNCETEEVSTCHYYSGLPSEVETAVTRQARLLEDEILANNELGKQVLKLREEKEQLLDTVWLATSGSQIKELWTRVLERLDQEPTALQTDALMIGMNDRPSQQES